MNGGRLPSLMAHIINRKALIVVIVLSAIGFSAGCSSVGGDPKEDANKAVSAANRSISEHNKLFGEARSIYEDVKNKIETSEDPSKEKDRITQARSQMQEARGNLQDARSSMQEVQDLDVEPAVKDYAETLTTAMNDQLAAEAKEIEFYGILEKEPALEDQRDEAVDLLSEVGDGYEKAEESYEEAQKLADSKPKLIRVPGSGNGEQS